jgi:hypothetical protein
MANLIQCLGYSIGKIHSGLIGYLCDLYRDGNREPLESFLGALGIGISFKPVPRREWNSVDLAILDDEIGNLRILVETKVDDHEGGTSEENYQTVRYTKAWPSCDAYLFITLGMGEYYHAPYSNQFRWVRIRDFLRAIETIEDRGNMVITDWIEEIRREVGLQNAVLRGDRSRLRDYRAGSWNIYLLGQLAERLAPRLAAESIAADPTCYPYGARPDTILNFGWGREPQYMEINYSGRLNLKLSLDGSESTRRDAVEKAIEACRILEFDPKPTFHPTGKIGNSKTIASFEIGLTDTGEGALEYVHSAEETEQRLLSLLRIFYGKRDKNAPNPPLEPPGHMS